MHKIVHLSSVHGRYDIRIFHKLCKSLAANGYHVSFCVSDGKGDEDLDGVNIVDAGGPYQNRFLRILLTSYKTYKKSLSLNGEIYHFHDPELLPYGILLMFSGKKVIFDSHEDIEYDIKQKIYLSKYLRVVFARVYKIIEILFAKNFNALVGATPHIAERLGMYHKNVVNLNNYPILKETIGEGSLSKDRTIVYTGVIASFRGIREVIKALEDVPNVKLYIAGKFAEENVKLEVINYEGWKKVEYLGQIGRQEIIELYQKACIGIVTFHPLPNHIDSQPNKLFEYLGAGLAVVGSNFPLWQEIIEKNECGICVDPLDEKSIAQGINSLLDSMDMTKNYGRNGYNLIQNKYNWEVESQKLLSLYSQILS
jgi:glycosyltransferase involved in cell wall biosynthesis